MATFVHYFLHFIFPGFIAWWFYRSKWKYVYAILLLTMLVDLDHLLANPVFDPNRCSIGFHPLHSYYAIACYVILFFFKKTRLVAIGLLLHMATDGLDCILNLPAGTLQERLQLTIQPAIAQSITLRLSI